MGDKNLWTKVGLIALLVGLCVWQIYPPEKQLKPGIDLGGGHSLLFEIDTKGDTHGSDLSTRVMDILKRRVDPQGQRNLVWRPVGGNRLEIQIPRAPENQKTLRQNYEKAAAELTATNISEQQIRAALNRSPAERDAAFAKLVGQVKSREELFKKLAAADNRQRELNTATQPVEGEQAKEADKVLTERRELVKQILATNLDVRVLSDTLELGKDSQTRAAKLAQIEQQHPDLTDIIHNITIKYDDWATQKGMLEDPADLMRLLKGAGKLEFRILAEKRKESPDMLEATIPALREPISKYTEQLAKYGPRPREGDKYQWFKIAKPEENSIAKPGSDYVVADYLGTKYVLAHNTEPEMALLKSDTGSPWALRAARPDRDSAGRLAIAFSLDPAGGNKFATMTGANLHRPLCIFMDDQAISAATIQSKIRENGQITGQFTSQEVMYLVNTLEAGVLPARLKETPLQQKSIGATLGSTNITKGLMAVQISFLAVVAFMFIYYTYNGAIADIALILNLVLTLGIMSFIQATFTLPGIAGLVLTLGMAVDANVLIYERMREELQRGVSTRMAVKLGYEKAFSAILDSNVTTIITAVILFALGSEEIRGFGLTLGIGLAVSMFTALFVTRQYFNVMVPQTLNPQEVRKAWLTGVILSLIGGVFFALGWLTHKAAPTGLGEFVLVLAAATLGLLLSMWLFRAIYRITGHQKANRLPMMKLFSAPNIDWMGKYKLFWAGSAIVIAIGLLFMAKLDRHDYLDIEFIGGTSVQVQLTDQATQSGKPGDELIKTRMGMYNPDDPTTSAGWLKKAADQIRNAQVTAAGENRFLVKTTEPYTPTEFQAMLILRLQDILVRGGIVNAEQPGSIYLLLNSNQKEVTTAEGVQERLAQAADYLNIAVKNIRNVRVNSTREETVSGEVRSAYDVVTTETDQNLVAAAMLGSMSNILKMSQPIHAQLLTDPGRAPDGTFPIRQSDSVLADVVPGATQDSVAEFKGGVAIVFDQLDPAASEKEVEQRINEMRLQPDFEGIGQRQTRVIGLEEAGQSDGQQTFKKIAVLVVEPNQLYLDGEDNAGWQSDVASKELKLSQAALARATTLQRVTQFMPQVAGEAVQKAIIAIILSFIAIAVYLWVRFGQIDFGVSGVIALYHDVAVALGAVMLSHFIWDTPIGRVLLLQDFRIDLNIIAALLTLVGFSINDTIVIFDRIRENRGRMAIVSPKLINDSLNQTLSRTILTTFTVLMTVLVMYIWGGEGIHGFAFTMLVGSISGTYSTLAIATPMIHHPRAMWIVSITLAAATLAIIILQLDNRTLQAILLVLVGIAAIAVLVRQIKATSGLRKPLPQEDVELANNR